MGPARQRHFAGYDRGLDYMLYYRTTSTPEAFRRVTPGRGLHADCIALSLLNEFYKTVTAHSRCLLAHISHLTSRALACDLRYTLEKQGYSAKSCQGDRGTPWVTPKKTICGSVLTVG